MFAGSARRPVDAILAFSLVDMEKIQDARWLSLDVYAYALKAAAIWAARAKEAEQRHS